MAETGAEAARGVAIFGGSFNPPHMAHVLAIAWVLASEEVEEVVVVPTYRHPFAKPLAPYDARVRMCELAVDFFSRERVTVSRVEEELGGDSRTLRTLEHFSALHPGWRMRLVMGADLLLEADKWFRFDRVKELAPPLVLGRAGFAPPGAPAPALPSISSTAIREHLAAGRWAELSPLLPRKVRSYVKEHRLYGA